MARTLNLQSHKVSLTLLGTMKGLLSIKTSSSRKVSFSQAKLGLEKLLIRDPELQDEISMKTFEALLRVGSRILRFVSRASSDRADALNNLPARENLAHAYNARHASVRDDKKYILAYLLMPLTFLFSHGVFAQMPPGAEQTTDIASLITQNTPQEIAAPSVAPTPPTTAEPTPAPPVETTGATPEPQLPEDPQWGKSPPIAGQVTVLHGLDKITARVFALEVKHNQPISFGTLRVTVRGCKRTPPEEPPESAAFLEITEEKKDEAPKALFSGWMFASRPSVSALEHPVYDIWVTECIADKKPKPSNP
jgi:hypothetical protein